MRHGQWRISNLHGNNHLLLTPTEFAADYQLRNLYFFDPWASTWSRTPSTCRCRTPRPT